MKFLVAFVAVVAVCVASPLKGNKPLANEVAELEAIIAAIQSPSTDPATAALLEQQLQDILAINPEPVIVGPAVVDTIIPEPVVVGPALVDYEPISVGPAIVDFPIPDGGAVTAPEAAVVPTPIQPSPVVIGEIESGQSPLVQIIVNVNQPESGPSPAPAVVPEDKPQPIIIVDEAENVEHIIPEPVIVVDPVVVEPVQVVEPVIVEPVVIGTPIIPAPAVVLPEELN